MADMIRVKLPKIYLQALIDATKKQQKIRGENKRQKTKIPLLWNAFDPILIIGLGIVQHFVLISGR